eukprot:TRINITY_DN60171_c0_g1_i1.p4 TRINITY_DN60171_c0_g1~~TRINITY_DN60171_c0_g1_i1.p4  ORF type:complete len:112 (+),score=5.32 TRINITY_DN60171_c0_g1_i1:352-687(+)
MLVTSSNRFPDASIGVRFPDGFRVGRALVDTATAFRVIASVGLVNVRFLEGHLGVPINGREHLRKFVVAEPEVQPVSKRASGGTCVFDGMSGPQERAQLAATAQEGVLCSN